MGQTMGQTAVPARIQAPPGESWRAPEALSIARTHGLFWCAEKTTSRRARLATAANHGFDAATLRFSDATI